MLLISFLINILRIKYIILISVHAHPASVGKTFFLIIKWAKNEHLTVVEEKYKEEMKT